MTRTPPAPRIHQGERPDGAAGVAEGVGAPPVPVADGLAANGGTSAVSAPTRLTMPYPYWASRPVGPLSMAVAVSRCTTSVADRFGNLARTNAAAPATIAVASLVPVPLTYPCPSAGCTTSTAGADSITSGPLIAISA